VNIKLPSTMSKKLAAKFIGPLKVAKVISPVAYQVALPSSLKIHDVFHVSLLQPWREDAEFPDHVHVAPAPPVFEDDDQYYVEMLLDKRVRKAGRHTHVEYLVRWKDYGPQDDSWVVASNIEDSLIAAYEATHHADIPVAPRSTRKSTRRRT